MTMIALSHPPPTGRDDVSYLAENDATSTHSRRNLQPPPPRLGYPPKLALRIYGGALKTIHESSAVIGDLHPVPEWYRLISSMTIPPALGLSSLGSRVVLASAYLQTRPQEEESRLKDQLEKLHQPYSTLPNQKSAQGDQRMRRSDESHVQEKASNETPKDDSHTNNHNKQPSNSSNVSRRSASQSYVRSHKDDTSSYIIAALNQDQENRSTIHSNCRTINFKKSATNGLLLSNQDDKNHNYDGKGRCIHHPYIQLRKKELFKMKNSWKILMTNCPDCCIEELYALHHGNNHDESTIGPIIKDSKAKGCGLTHKLERQLSPASSTSPLKRRTSICTASTSLSSSCGSTRSQGKQNCYSFRLSRCNPSTQSTIVRDENSIPSNSRLFMKVASHSRRRFWVKNDTWLKSVDPHAPQVADIPQSFVNPNNDMNPLQLQSSMPACTPQPSAAKTPAPLIIAPLLPGIYVAI